MRTSRNTNNRKPFLKYMQEKLAITVLVITLALFALVLVLYNIVKEKKDDYTQIVLSQQEYDSRVIPYQRGSIVDRNNNQLAVSQQVYNLIIDPKQIMSKQGDYLEATMAALEECFGYDRNELNTLITEKKDIAYVRYTRQLSHEDKDKFEKLQEAKNTAYAKEGVKTRVKGVWFENEYKRYYPYGKLACNVIGFARKDGMEGTGGIEQYYNSVLTGTNGREYGYLNDDSNLERVIKPAENGNTVVSTIDLNIQKIAEKYIGEWQAGIGSDMAAVVVMDPNTGEVLAMASSREFDLNDPRNLSAYYSQEEIDAMNETQKSEAWNQMWRNFCVSDTFEPGSPQKVFTVAAALEEGVVSQDENFQCNGMLEIGGWEIKCVARSGHGPINLTQSLMKSCNVVMMNISARTGKEKFSKYQEIFGFGSKTAVDLPGEADTKNLIYKAENMGASDLATNSFGQNYNCTMIQMAAAYSSVINGGSYYEPHVVKQILNEQNAVVKKIEPVLVRETVSENTSNYIREALHLTVSEGTGAAAKVAGYEVGGKTGTAERYPRADKNYLVSFAGFAPADNPQVVVYVVIDVPHLPAGPQQAHSSFASEIFGKIMGDILPYMNVFPTTDIPGTEEEPGNVTEGITSNTEESEAVPGHGDENAPEETTATSYTEEFIVPEEGEPALPGQMPGETTVQGTEPTSEPLSIPPSEAPSP